MNARRALTWSLSIWSVTALACAVAAEAQPDPPTARILLLYGPAPEGPSIVSFSYQLRLTLRKELGGPVEFYEEFLDLDRFPQRERWPQLARYFADKYRGFRLDAVVAVGSVPLQFAITRLSGLMPGVPVVFGMTFAQNVNLSALPPNITGRMLTMPVVQTLAMARRLQPHADQFAVIGGTSAIDSVAVAATLSAFASLRDSLRLIELRGLSLNELLGALRQLTPRTIVFFAYMRRDRNGQVFVPGELGATLARASGAPVYSFVHTLMGEGMLGGAMLRADDEGARTARLIVRVLRRGPGEPMPPIEAIGTTFFADWRQLQRWGMSERQLPPGTRVLFRTPTAWERYIGAITGAVLLFAAQSLLIGLLLLERRRRIRAQRAVDEQMAYEQMIAELTTDAVRVADDETSCALEEALARIGRYTGARAAVLVEYPDVPFRPPSQLTWLPSSGAANSHGTGPPRPIWFTHGDSRLDIALVADGLPIGALELYSANGIGGWSERLIGRVDAAGELLASAIARARATRAVRRGEELNEAVLASLSAPIAILDRNGTIIRVNEAWRQRAESAGVDAGRDAFLGESYIDECRRAESRGCDEAHDVRTGIEAVLARRTWPFRHEYRWSSPDERWYELVVDRLEHVDGGAIVTHLDITDRRFAELRAEETRRQVTHLGRVAMVGELASAISHELRQPLAAIRANAEAGALLLRQNPPELAEAKEIFMDIVVDDVRASEIIDQVRTLLRKEEPAKKTVSLNEICRQAVHLLHRDAVLRSTRVELALEPRLPSVSGDPVQLQQVVLNLTLNALDAAMSSAGERDVTVGTAMCEGEVEIFVRDSGCGLHPDVQSHLFESFFSTKAQGLGMGLVIVRSIVERHHGRMRAENDAAGGAVFRVLLPVSKQAERRA